MVRVSAVAALVAALLSVTVSASGHQRHTFDDPLARVFNSWDLTKPARYVRAFEEVAEVHPEVHEQEHIRRKRDASERAQYAVANPITKSCDRPGYTGQFCEFPICDQINPEFPVPRAGNEQDDYGIDFDVLSNCTRAHELFVDETMGDIRILVQSEMPYNPQFQLQDANGNMIPYVTKTQTPNSMIGRYSSLAPGAYLVIPSADDSTHSCVLSVYAKSAMALAGGFSTDDRDRSDFPSQNAQFHAFNSILLHMDGLTYPGTIKTVKVYAPDNTVERPRTLDTRYHCAYEYYFDSLFCSSQGTYSLVVEGVSFSGYIFSRAFNFDCVGSFPTGPTTQGPTQAPPSTCYNGLLLPGDASTPASCMCSDVWTGAQCTVPVCMNGGKLQTDENGHGYCVCVPGFYGTFCQDVLCDPASEHGFSVEHPTLVLVLRQRQAMNEVNGHVYDAVVKLLSDLASDPTYLVRFQVVLFNNDKLISSKYYNKQADMLAALLSVSQSTDTTGGCSDIVFGSLATGLSNLAITSRSIIYVVTDAIGDDYDSDVQTILNWNSYWQATINFLLVDTGDATCSHDVSSPGFRNMDDLSNRFSGLTLQLTPGTVYNVLYNHMTNILYRSQLMIASDRSECDKGLVKSIHVDKYTDQIVIISKGTGFLPNITTPNVDGRPPSIVAILQEDYFSMWLIQGAVQGQYIISGGTSPPTASCNFRVYQASYKSASAPAKPELFWSVTNDIDVDGFLLQPLEFFDNHLTVHIENLPIFEDPDHAVTSLNIFTDRGGYETTTYAANGMFRDGCSFDFFFPAFHCRANDLLHFEFFVRGPDGFYVQRGGVMSCMNVIPTPSPPEDCLNGGVMINGTCLCQPRFTGDHCQTTVCDNGGTFNAQVDACMCAVGWGGPFCDQPICYEEGPKPNTGLRIDMAFVVETTAAGVQQVKALAQSMPEIIRDIQQQHPDWVDRLVLVTYNSTWAGIAVDAPISSPSRFLDYLNQIASSTPTDKGCVVETWAALLATMRERYDGNQQRVLPRKSVVTLLEASSPNNTALLATSVSEELIQREIIFNVFQQLDTTTKNWTCGTTQADLVYVEQATTRGNGKMYSVINDDILLVSRIIPTLYSSSLIYKFAADDCTAEVRAIFPVDSHTQTLTAIVAGYQSTISLHRSNDLAFPDESTVSILQNDMTNVVEFRNSCPENWDPVSQYCLYADPQTSVTFADGDAFCQAEGAYQFDDLTLTKHQYMTTFLGRYKAWLGIQLVGGNWFFESDTAQTQPVTTGYWQGGVTPADASKPCAYFDPSLAYNGVTGVWIASVCTDKYYVVCQQHMYSPDQQPSDVGEDDLTSGKYYLSVVVDGGAPNGWKGCNVEIRAQSLLQVEYGWVDDRRKDFPNHVANIDSNSNRIISSISVGNARSTTALLRQAMLRSSDSSSALLEASPLMYRFGCSYEYYSHTLNCDETNDADFDVVHVGIDDRAATFQRYSPSLCFKWTYLCQNGGVYSNGKCVCPDYYTGDTCRTPMCQNGGTLENGRSCRCPAGWGGSACQWARCEQRNPLDFQNDGKTFALLLERSNATKGTIDFLAKNLDTVLEVATAAHPDWFKYYVVLSFDINGNIDPIRINSDIPTTMHELQSVADSITEADLSGCRMPIFEAISSLFLQDRYLDGAEVLLISAAYPLDADVANVLAAKENFGTNHPVIDYLHLENSACDVNDYTADLKDFFNFIDSTHGEIVRTLPENVQPLLGPFLSSRYAPQKLAFTSNRDCQQNTFYVQIDAEMQDVYVINSGVGASASGIDPMRNLLDESTLSTVYQTQENNLWHLSPSTPGTFTITTSSTEQNCFANVYASPGIQVVAGFVTDTAQDTPSQFAVYGQVNYPVFHVVDKSDDRSFAYLYYATMQRQTSDGTYMPPYTSTIDFRVDCTYNYIGGGFVCEQPNEFISLTVSGVDENGQVYSRDVSTWCRASGDIPTTAAPATTTTVPTVPTTTTTVRPPTPKDILFDVIFLVDDTEDRDFLDNVASPFVLATMDAFTVSQSRARVGIINVPSETGITLPISFLGASNSVDALKQNLLSLDDWLDLTGTEEIITQALKYADDPTKFRSPANGYRNYINNHLLVFLTSKPEKMADVDAASAQAASILSSNDYGIIAVGYGNVDTTNLKRLTNPDCIYTAADAATLNASVAPMIQSKIWAAYNSTNGAYCGPLA